MRQNRCGFMLPLTPTKQAELEYLCENSDMYTLCIVNGEKTVILCKMTYQMLPELKTCERGHLSSSRFPFMKTLYTLGRKHRGMYKYAGIIIVGQHGRQQRTNQAQRTSRLSRCGQYAVQYRVPQVFLKGYVITP